MSRHGRRSRAVVLLPAGALALVGSLETWNGRESFPALRMLEEPVTVASILASALLVFGAILLCAATIALAARPPTPRAVAVVPVVGAAGAGLFGVRTGLVATTASVPTATSMGTFVLTVVVAGTAVAPIAIATTREHTPVLLAGAIGFLAAIFSSPAPISTALVGAASGISAVGTLWIVDAKAWRP